MFKDWLVVYKNLFGLKFSKIINDIHSVLFPSLCFGCNAQLFRGEHLICTVCRNDLPLTDFNFHQVNMVDKALYGRAPIEKAASFLYFRQHGIVKNLLHQLKYKNQPQISSFLGQWYGNLLKQQRMDQLIEVVVPVPLHQKKRKTRGYNQVDGFAQTIAQALNADFEPKALIKTANTKTQTKKTRFLRGQADQKLFQLNSDIDLTAKTVLLVDDVMTTGATLELCALALDQAKNIKIYVATMAVVPKLGI